MTSVWGREGIERFVRKINKVSSKAAYLLMLKQYLNSLRKEGDHHEPLPARH